MRRPGFEPGQPAFSSQSRMEGWSPARLDYQRIDYVKFRTILYNDWFGTFQIFLLLFPSLLKDVSLCCTDRLGKETISNHIKGS